jgi:hypothetical protein
MKEFHVTTEVFVVVQVDDDATPEDAERAVAEWLSESCPFPEMEVNPVNVSRCTADDEHARMRKATSN